jgi:hypothetical protein
LVDVSNNVISDVSKLRLLKFVHKSSKSNKCVIKLMYGERESGYMHRRGSSVVAHKDFNKSVDVTRKRSV